MSWSKRLFGLEADQSDEKGRSAQTVETLMSPGLDGDFDWELREKAGLHDPPAPPEYMGIEGEYDVNGLAKRVAIAFDQDPMAADVETITIEQNGSSICLKGFVPKRELLDRLVEIAAKVDGTKAVDTTQVIIESL